MFLIRIHSHSGSGGVDGSLDHWCNGDGILSWESHHLDYFSDLVVRNAVANGD